MDTTKSGFTSKLVHAGSTPDPLGSAVTPIYQTSTFSFMPNSKTDLVALHHHLAWQL